MTIVDCRLGRIGAGRCLVLLCLGLLAGVAVGAETSPNRAPDFVAKALSAELDGFEFAARLRTDDDRDYLLLFRKGENLRLAAWTTGERHRTMLPLDVSQVEIVSLTGERSQCEVKDGSLELQLSGSVQYVEPVGTSRRWEIEAGWKIRTSTQLTDDGIAASVESEIPGADIGELSVSGSGVEPAATGLPANTDTGTTCLRVSTRYVCSGEAKAKVKVTLAMPGMKSPLVRVVELDQSGCPQVQVMPPANNELWFVINRPKSDRESAFKGAVYVGNTRGLRLQTESCRFGIPKDEDRTTARVKLSQAPEAVYSFSYRLLNEKKKELLRARTRRYSVIETFADGKAGDDVRRYQIEPDGDSKVAASAKLTYLKSPKGAPEELCAKLDYEFGEGRRFVRISPRPMIPIAQRPSKAWLWVKGDGQGGLARLRFRGSDGQVFQQDYGKLDFSDWRHLEADMTGEGAEHWGGKDDGVVRYPIEWDTVFLVDNTGGQKVKGSVMLGTMMLCYD